MFPLKHMSKYIKKFYKIQIPTLINFIKTHGWRWSTSTDMWNLKNLLYILSFISDINFTFSYFHLVLSLGGFYFNVAEYSGYDRQYWIRIQDQTLTPLPPHSRDNLEPNMLSKWIRILDILVSLYGIKIFSFLFSV